MDAKYLSRGGEWELSAVYQPALHAILLGTAYSRGTQPHCLWHANCAAAPGHSMYCEGREKEAISWDGSANLTFKSPYTVAFISVLAAEVGRLLKRMHGKEKHPTGAMS